MKIKTISAKVRYSSSVGEFKQKTIELGAEGAISEKEDWIEEQEKLYALLSKQLVKQWKSKSK